MDWTVILIALGFVAVLGGRFVVGVCFEGSWLGRLLEGGDGDGCDGGDGGGD